MSIGSYGVGRNHHSVSPVIVTAPYKYDPGHILRHSTLKAVTAQLRSASVSYFTMVIGFTCKLGPVASRS